MRAAALSAAGSIRRPDEFVSDSGQTAVTMVDRRRTLETVVDVERV